MSKEHMDRLAMMLAQRGPMGGAAPGAVDQIARAIMARTMPQAAPSPGMVPEMGMAPDFGGYAAPAPDVPSRGEQRATMMPADPDMMGAEQVFKRNGTAPARRYKQSERPTLNDRDAVAQLGLNSGETKATGWAARMLQAESILQNLEDQGTRTGQHMLTWLPGETLENNLFDDEYRQYRQAAEAFINSALRADTGAQINNSEADRMMRELLPAPGDDPQTVAQKRASRHAFILSLMTGASEAAPFLPEIGEPVVPIEQVAPPDLSGMSDEELLRALQGGN